MAPSLVYDEIIVGEFLSALHQDMRPNETGIVSLFARRKYWLDLSVSQKQLCRQLLRFPGVTEEDVKVREFERVVKRVCTGEYVDESTELTIPADAMVAYASLNPLCVVMGFADTQREVLMRASGLSHPSQLHDVDKMLVANIQRNVSRKVFMDIDVDSKEPKVLERVLDLFTSKVFAIIETRGGYHVVMRMDDVTKKEHQAIHDLRTETAYMKPNVHGENVQDHVISVSRGNQVPLPGTMQGGFPVRLIWTNRAQLKPPL